MLFSIIVPMYNSEKTIRNCINSIISQTFMDFEIVIINDGSTDNSLDIVQEYLNVDTRIKIYSFKNAGVSVSRQRGIDLSSGKYILFVDSDDTINQELLETLYFYISMLDEPDIIRYQCDLISDASHKNHQRYNFHGLLYVLTQGIVALRNWSTYGEKYAVYWLFAFKRSLFSSISSFPDLKCYEDVALIPILIAKSQTAITINYIGYNYTCNNSTSLTHTKDLLSEKSRAIDFAKAYQYAIEHFKMLNNLSEVDLAFFVNDYNKRLKNKFNSLSPTLQREVSQLYNY